MALSRLRKLLSIRNLKPQPRWRLVLFDYIFDTGPWYVRVPAWFFSTAIAVSILLMILVFIVNLAVSMGWWGIVFIIALIVGVIVTAVAESVSREERAKKVKQIRQ